MFCGGTPDLPSLVVFDVDGTCITRDARSKVVQSLDQFPWRADPDLRSKCYKIHGLFDVDKDLHLNLFEVNRLALETGGSPLSEGFWFTFCGHLGTNPHFG